MPLTDWIERIFPGSGTSSRNSPRGGVRTVDWWSTEGLANTMRQQAGSIEEEEKRRYQQGLGVLQGAYEKTSKTLDSTIDPNLLFSRASDTVGARSRSMIESLRGSLGSRGLNANSGAASGLLSRLAMSQEGQLIGATRDIAIENQRQRQANAAINFANALNLAGYTNAPVSGAMLETTQNLFEGSLAREGLAAQRSMANSANKTNLLGGIIGGVGSILGGLI